MYDEFTVIDVVEELLDRSGVFTFASRQWLTQEEIDFIESYGFKITNSEYVRGRPFINYTVIRK